MNTGVPQFTEDFTYDIDAPKQEIKHQIAKLTAYKRFDNIGKFSFQYDYQQNNRLEFDIRRDSFPSSSNCITITPDNILVSEAIGMVVSLSIGILAKIFETPR